MTGLLDLSNEIVLQIASYIKPRPLTLHSGFPAHRWPEVLKDHDRRSSKQAQHLSCLVLSCRRFHELISGSLYEYIPLLESSVRSQQFLQTLENNKTVCDYLHHVSINSEGLESVEQLHPVLFRSSSIRSINLMGYDVWDATLSDEENQYYGQTSPVEVLRLLECGAHEGALHQLLNYPRALKELWYDVNQGEWSGYYEGTAPVEFSCEAVRRSLDYQMRSLEHFSFTRPVQVHEGLGYGDLLDLSQFTALRTLCINQVFLVGLQPDFDIGKHLPTTLEELEIFYDDTGYVDFLKDDAPAPEWLFHLLRQPLDNGDKPVFTPELKRLRIVSMEWWPEQGSDYEEDEEENEIRNNHEVGNNTVIFNGSRLRSHPDSPWRPPEALLKGLCQANLPSLSWSIFLHQRRRCLCVPEGGSGFATEWEEFWNPEGDDVY